MSDANAHIPLEYHNLSELVHQTISPELERVMRLHEAQPNTASFFLQFENKHVANILVEGLPRIFQAIKNIASIEDMPVSPTNGERNVFGLKAAATKSIRDLLLKDDKIRPVPDMRSRLLRTMPISKVRFIPGIEISGADAAYWLEALDLYLKDIDPAHLSMALGGDHTIALVNSYKILQQER